MRCDAFHEIISEENTEWVPTLVSFTNEIETKCPDGDVVGHARSARRQAIAFSDTKCHERAYTFDGCLASLLLASSQHRAWDSSTRPSQLAHCQANTELNQTKYPNPKIGS